LRPERGAQRISLPPFDPGISGLPLRRLIEHRLVEIGRDDAYGRGQARRHRARQHTGSRRGLKHILRRGVSDAFGEIARVGFENQRNKESFVEFRNRSGEQLIGRRHRSALPKGSGTRSS